MRVHGPNQPGGPDRTQGDRTTKARAEKPAAGGGRAERTTVSDGARALANARSPEQPDELRVARLKQAIREGTFQVNVDKIADAILREET